VLGGALGNMVDRIVRGYVVDFIHVKGWPIFNVADIAVVVGVGLMLLSRVRRRPRIRAPAEP
jgi:signal peptidase II